MPKPRNSSPARSHSGISTPRRNQPRRSRSVCSPALSTASGRLTSVIDQFKEKNMDSFAVSPLTTRRSVLSDNTEIEIPRRKSWWKNLNENSRDVMEFLEENKADQNTAIEDIVDIEVLSQEKKNYTLDLPESSDNESINSIVLPQRKLFTQKENHPQKKFGQLVGTRETLAKLHKANTTHIDKTITVGTRELFQGTKRTKPIFPAALLGISPNKTTADKTKENIGAEPVVPVRNIFGNRPANKRKNMFADFVVSESEDDISDIQPRKIFGFQKKDEQRRISAISKGRDPSPTSSITTDIELDDWQHLPSSTMVENQLDEMIVGHTPVKRARLSKLSEAKESEIGITNIDSSANKTKQSNKSVSSKSKSSRSSRSLNNAENISDKTKSKENEDGVEISVGQISIKQADLDKQSEVNKSKQSNKAVLSRSKSSITNNISHNNSANTIDKTKSKQVEEMEDNEETTMKQAKPSKLSRAIESDVGTTKIDSSMNKTLKSKTSRSMNNLSPNNEDKTKKNQTEVNENELESNFGQNNSVRRTRLSKQKELKESNANNTKETNVDKTNQSLKNKDEGEMIMDTNDDPENPIDDGQEISNELIESKASETEAKEDEDSMSLGNAEDSEEEIGEMDVSQAAEDNTNDEENEKTIQKVAEQNKNNEENYSLEINDGNESKSGEDAIQHIVSQKVDEDDTFDKDKANKSIEYNISTKAVVDNERADRSVKEIINEDLDETKQQKDMKNVSQAVKKKNDILNENQETEENNTESDEENENQNISRVVLQEGGDENYQENVSQVEKDNESDEENENQEVDDESNENRNDEVHEIEDDEQEEEEEESLVYQDSDNDEVDNVDQNEDHDEINQSQDNDEINHSQENDESGNEEQDVEKENAIEELDKYGATESDIDNEDEANESLEVENEANESQEIENESEQDEPNDSEDEEDEANDSQIENESEQDEPNASQAIESDQDQEMEDSNDADEAVADEVSEDEQEEMEVDDDNEESQEIDTEPVHTEEIIEESPNVTHDTTGRNRKKVKSPEVILHDKTNQDVSFTAKGRNTSIRKTKSMYKDLNIRPSLAPQRDSLGLSGPDSSAEGSGWDSHRTTRKTLRQTFGRDFTIRKSLRALVMEKSAKQTEHMDTLHSETVKFPQANSTELPEDSNREDASMESDHEMSRRTRQTTLETYLQNIKQQNIEKKMKMEEAIRNSLKTPSARDTLSLFKVPSKPAPRKLKSASNKPKKQLKSAILFDELPSEVIQDMKYKPPKRFQPSNASWITKRLYKFLEGKLETKYDYKARVRAEKLVETIYFFTKELRRNDVASLDAVDVLKHELARLDIVKTHFDFYEFFHEYMPREVRIKVVPDIVNKIPLPRHGVFTDILRGNTVQG